MPDRQERTHGPYPHRNRWRVVIVRADGQRIVGSYKTLAAAEKALDELREKTDARTVSTAVDEYGDQLRAKGRRETTLTTIAHRLRGLLRTTERDRALRGLTPLVARTLWERRCAEIAGETQRGELATVQAFAAWCVRQGWLGADPFAGLEPTKPRGRGKPQLRIDEARAWVDLALAEDTDEGLAAAMAVLMGLRASEITQRVVRDVDDGARVLWIDRAKTRAGDRQLEVPEVLRPRLAALVAGRGGGELLWRDPKNDRHWLYRHVKRLCKLAGVPAVSPHGLRGTWSSIGAESMPVDQVARALGHVSAAVTRRHYVSAGSERTGRQRATLRVLAGGSK